MGLDIYIRKGKRKDIKDKCISSAYDVFSNIKRDKYFEMLKRWNPSKFKTEKAAIDKLVRMMRIYDSSCHRYDDWNMDKKRWESNITTIEDAKKYVENTLANKDDFYSESDLYYRKVNFLYAFFNVDHNFEMAWIEKEDAEKLVKKCNEVLALDKEHLSDAKEILPTQSGFFFGSTDYDDWYIDDVKQVKREFTKYLKTWADDEVAIIEYSW